VGSQPRCFISSVSPVNVASNSGLKVPRRNQNDVSNANPDSSLQFSSDSTQPFVTVLALDHDSIKAKKFDSYS
jgi:hypothetical protein